MKKEKILTAEQVADIEKVSTKTIHEWRKEGRITQVFQVGKNKKKIYLFYSDYKITSKNK